jgi:hypothetical protein
VLLLRFWNHVKHLSFSYLVVFLETRKREKAAVKECRSSKVERVCWCAGRGYFTRERPLAPESGGLSRLV